MQYINQKLEIFHHLFQHEKNENERNSAIMGIINLNIINLGYILMEFKKNNMRKLYFTLFIVLYTSTFLIAQYNQEPVHPDLSGNELYDVLVDEYKPYYILNYDMARDTLFKRVFNEGDSLYCIYTRHAVYMDPDEDPSTTVYNNGKDDGINTEHLYPRSKGAQYGNAKSDMHSLYPCKINVNTMRSNFPLGDIPINSTQWWFYKDKMQRNKPSNNIEEYARWRDGMVEPRHAAKGEVARSMMYFFTMYRQEAMDADPDFFEIQRKTMCEWHDMYPVDSMEYVRSFIIADYQDGKVNPFVLDCSLASRLYCSDVEQTCQVTSIAAVDISLYNIKIMGNPVVGNTIKVTVESPEPGYWTVQMMNSLGQVVNREDLLFSTEFHSWEIARNNLPEGVYFLEFSYGKAPSGKRLRLPVQKLILH